MDSVSAGVKLLCDTKADFCSPDFQQTFLLSLQQFTSLLNHITFFFFFFYSSFNIFLWFLSFQTLFLNKAFVQAATFIFQEHIQSPEAVLERPRRQLQEEIPADCMLSKWTSDIYSSHVMLFKHSHSLSNELCATATLTLDLSGNVSAAGFSYHPEKAQDDSEAFSDPPSWQGSLMVTEMSTAEVCPYKSNV